MKKVVVFLKGFIASISGMVTGRRRQIPLPVKKIKVNQAGYLPSEEKVFLYTSAAKNLAGKCFKVIRLSDGKAIKGRLGQAVMDKDSGDQNYRGDFSFLTEPGQYIVRIGPEESYPFEITGRKYHDLFYVTMRSYYLQRCGMAIHDPISGVAHPACHLKDSYPEGDPSGLRMDTTGGWHEAGDYCKCIPPAAVTVAQLLLMYELSPVTFDRFNLNIPKAKGYEHLSDILTEIKYELDWMLKMQDTRDGGVYYKVHSYDFPPLDRAPEDDKAVRYYYGKGTAVTADFAAVTAIAARVFAQADPKYAEKLKKAALLAGEFLIRLNGQILEPSYGKTRTYMTGSVKDDLCWAYAELYRLTGGRNYLEMAGLNWENNWVPVNWDNVSFLGIYSLLANPETPRELYEKWAPGLIQWVDNIRARIAMNGYRVALMNDEYIWASARTILAYGMTLVLVQKLLGGMDFDAEVKNQLDYVLGMNPLSKVYITKVGTDYVRNLHHRLVVSKGILVPGLLVGGPNNRAEDGQYPRGLGPRGYVDLTAACSCNENAIDYNAPLVFVAGYFWMKEQERSEI